MRQASLYRLSSFENCLFSTSPCRSNLLYLGLSNAISLSDTPTGTAETLSGRNCTSLNNGAMCKIHGSSGSLSSSSQFLGLTNCVRALVILQSATRARARGDSARTAQIPAPARRRALASPPPSSGSAATTSLPASKDGAPPPVHAASSAPRPARGSLTEVGGRNLSRSSSLSGGPLDPRTPPAYYPWTDPAAEGAATMTVWLAYFAGFEMCWLILPLHATARIKKWL